MDGRAEIKLSLKQSGDGGVSVLSRWPFLFSEIPEAQACSPKAMAGEDIGED